MKYLMLTLGILTIILSNTVGLAYFPLNLPFSFVGGLLSGWFGAKLILE